MLKEYFKIRKIIELSKRILGKMFLGAILSSIILGSFLGVALAIFNYPIPSLVILGLIFCLAIGHTFQEMYIQ